MICDLCGQKYNGLIGLAQHIKNSHKNYNNKQYYDEFLKKENEGICYECGQKTQYRGLKGYNKFCSTKCSTNNTYIKNKMRETLKHNYGVESPLQSKKIRDKSKQTCLEKYGVKNPSQNEKIKNKKKQTSLINYGVKNPNQSIEIKEKKKETCLKKYGVENVFQVDEYRKKWIETLLMKYGVDSNWKLDSVKKKKIKTYLKHYGVDNFSKSKLGRKIFRINAIKQYELRLEYGEPAMPMIGYIERKCLNTLQNIISYHIIRQDPSFRYIIGRFPDGYIKELKLFILFDERQHFDDYKCTILNEHSLIETDDYLTLKNYTIFRISEYDWNNNRRQVIENFKRKIKELENETNHIQ